MGTIRSPQGGDRAQQKQGNPPARGVPESTRVRTLLFMCDQRGKRYALPRFALRKYTVMNSFYVHGTKRRVNYQTCNLGITLKDSIGIDSREVFLCQSLVGDRAVGPTGERSCHYVLRELHRATRIRRSPKIDSLRSEERAVDDNVIHSENKHAEASQVCCA